MLPGFISDKLTLTLAPLIMEVHALLHGKQMTEIISPANVVNLLIKLDLLFWLIRLIIKKT